MVSQSPKVKPEDFFKQSRGAVILDTRSPSEFDAGHIPGSVSFPLFTDEERAAVGTTYKKSGQQKAILEGLQFVGPRMTEMCKKADRLAKGKPVYLYCWRGGMRSKSVEWLLSTFGLEVHRLEGGYKAYRTWMYEQFDKSRTFITLGGLTGCGKTEILHGLENQGEQILDLEELAGHKGSAFGNLAGAPQPTTEHFQNKLLDALLKLDEALPTWVEDESQHIGQVWINEQFYDQFKASPLVVLERPMSERVEHLCKVYADEDITSLALGFEKISKRLGGQHVKRAIESLQQNDFATAAEIALNYYDKSYNYMLSMRVCPKMKVGSSGQTEDEIASMLIREKDSYYVGAQAH